MEKNTKILAASAYALGIPALYIVLTSWHRDSFVGYHGKQALTLWLYFFLIFFGARLFINLIWSLIYIPHLDKLELLVGWGMWGYILSRGYRA